MLINWIRIWFTALLHPSVSKYEDLTNDPKASAKIGYIWVIITVTISGVISFVLQGNPQQLFYSIFCGIPSLIIMGLLSIVAIAGSVHGIARLMGGIGSYSKLVYIVSAFCAPMTILSCILYILPFGKWLNGIPTIYMIILTIIATRAVYKLSWGKSVISSVVLIIIALLASIAVFFLPNSN